MSAHMKWKWKWKCWENKGDGRRRGSSRRSRCLCFSPFRSPSSLDLVKSRWQPGQVRADAKACCKLGNGSLSHACPLFFPSFHKISHSDISPIVWAFTIAGFHSVVYYEAGRGESIWLLLRSAIFSIVVPWLEKRWEFYQKNKKRWEFYKKEEKQNYILT